MHSLQQIANLDIPLWSGAFMGFESEDDCSDIEDVERVSGTINNNIWFFHISNNNKLDIFIREK